MRLDIVGTNFFRYRRLVRRSYFALQEQSFANMKPTSVRDPLSSSPAIISWSKYQMRIHEADWTQAFADAQLTIQVGRLRGLEQFPRCR